MYCNLRLCTVKSLPKMSKGRQRVKSKVIENLNSNVQSFGGMDYNCVEKEGGT